MSDIELEQMKKYLIQREKIDPDQIKEIFSKRLEYHNNKLIFKETIEWPFYNNFTKIDNEYEDRVLLKFDRNYILNKN